MTKPEYPNTTFLLRLDYVSQFTHVIDEEPILALDSDNGEPIVYFFAVNV